MRRTLFGKSPDVERLTPARVSVREALTFDIVDHESSVDQTLIERRVGSWAVAPWLLLAGHIVIGISLLLLAAAALTNAQEAKKSSAASGVFTAAQAQRGKAEYAPSCASCHGIALVPSNADVPGSKIASIDPDLSKVIDAWPTLPEHLKAAVMALVATASR